MIKYYDKVFSLVDEDYKLGKEKVLIPSLSEDHIVTKLGVPIVSCLEGGYNPVKLAECMRNHLFALSGYG